MYFDRCVFGIDVILMLQRHLSACVLHHLITQNGTTTNFWDILFAQDIRSIFILQKLIPEYKCMHTRNVKGGKEEGEEKLV